MTWEAVQKSSLAKMFSTDAGEIDLTDDNNVDYVAAMPYAANEAIHYICNAGRRPRKSLLIEVANTGKAQGLKISDYCNDWFSAGDGEAYLIDEDTGVPESVSLQITANKYITVPAGLEGELEIYYDAVPETIDSDTDGDTEIDLDEDAASIIPLYIAAELYKDDDLTTSVYFRNEFEAALQALGRHTTGQQSGEWTSTTGW